MQLSNRPEDFPGFFPTVLWVGVGVFLFWTTPQSAFLSWQALVYFVFGTIAVGIVFGVLGRTIQKRIPGLDPANRTKGQAADPMMQTLGTLIGAAQLVLVYFLAKAVITQMLFPVAST